MAPRAKYTAVWLAAWIWLIPRAQGADPAWTTRLDQVQRRYDERVEPIFAGKCFDCHAEREWKPWYSWIPGAAGSITEQKTAALRRLNFTRGFPFEAPVGPREQLEMLRSSLADHDMPPSWYWAVTPGVALTEPEEGVILDWIAESLEILERGRLRR
ncbi:MAG TPA: heme-binding domain-containing protein [Bdellovibrionota bacterium]|nr:heme-binding domain-containing protein [Bdellovibrionota bacterium]